MLGKVLMYSYGCPRSLTGYNKMWLVGARLMWCLYVHTWIEHRPRCSCDIWIQLAEKAYVAVSIFIAICIVLGTDYPIPYLLSFGGLWETGDSPGARNV